MFEDPVYLLQRWSTINEMKEQYILGFPKWKNDRLMYLMKSLSPCINYTR